MPLRSRPLLGLMAGLITLACLNYLAPGVLAAAKPVTPKKSAARRPARARPAAVKKVRRWTDALKQYDNGAGILVCDPVAVEAEADVTEFGAGCGRWLHFVVAGHGELGKTPFWSDQETMRKALGRSDLRLTTADLAKVAQRAGINLGITHLALGEIRGTPAECSLTYQIWSVPEQKEVGAPLTLRGSEAEVIARLPLAAMGLSAAVGVTDPRVPLEVRESVEELRFVGSVPRVPVMNGPGMSAAQLHEIAARLDGEGDESKSSPPGLAAFLSMLYYSASGDLDPFTKVAKELARGMPENVLVAAEFAKQVCELKPPSAVELPLQSLHQHLERFPKNYALRSAQCRLQLRDDRRTEARRSAEQAVRCATRNPEAWSLLGTLVSLPAEKALVTRCESQTRAAP
jgi:hypothetical protein